MTAGLMDIMRREYLRLRGRLFVLFCVAVLALLAAGFFLPRTYVSDAVLAFDSNALDAMPATAEQLRALASRHAEGVLHVETRGRELLLGWEGARPAGLRETLKELIDALVAGTRESLADALDADAARLGSEVQAAREGQAAAQQALADALAALPEGGNAAAGARLGKLQAEADTLALEIRAGRARQAELQARVQELAAGLDEAQPRGARVQALEQQLRAAQCRAGKGSGRRRGLGGESRYRGGNRGREGRERQGATGGGCAVARACAGAERIGRMPARGMPGWWRGTRARRRSWQAWAASPRTTAGASGSCGAWSRRRAASWCAWRARTSRSSS